MRWRTLLAASVLGLGIVGCDKLPFIGKKEEAKAPAPTPGAVVQDSAALAEAAVADSTAAAGAAKPAPAHGRPAMAEGEEPWNPTLTGTVNPGMTQEEVVAVWGAPEAERQTGDWTYLYFRNGCERSCGTFDVIMLQGGHVVDAIVRGAGHIYSGMSSSPPDRVGAPTNIAPQAPSGAGA